MLLASMRTRVTDVPISLLDNSPLLDLLQHMLKLDKIQRNIDSGLLGVLSVTTSAYNTGESVSLY
jgi:NTE family protein